MSTSAIHSNATKVFFACGSGALTFNDVAEFGKPAEFDEIRVTNGVARYTSGFTPPTAPFPRSVGEGDSDFASVTLLLGFEETFTLTPDIGPVIGDVGSGVQDSHFATDRGFRMATGSYLNFLSYGFNQTVFDIAAGDFCIECFGVTGVPTQQATLVALYAPTGTERCYALQHVTAAPGVGWEWEYSREAQLGEVSQAISLHQGITMDSTTPADICIERSGTDLRFYINGVMLSKNTFNEEVYFSPLPFFTLGAERNSSGTRNNAWSGWMKAFRFTKAARYASDGGYTPPSLPLPTT